MAIMNKRKTDLVKLLFLNLVILFSIFCVNTFAETLTFHEDFEGTNPKFDATQGSGWGFSDSNEDTISYNKSRFLQNNAQGLNHFSRFSHRPVIGAQTLEPILVPDQPYLSFFYQSKLHSYERINVYVKYKVKKRKRLYNMYEEIIDKIATFKAHDNTGLIHKFKKISLKRYKGKQVKILFSHNGDLFDRGLFLMDDIRVGTMPSSDQDKDGIPDSYDSTPNGEQLPQITNIKAEQNNSPYVRISWDKMENQQSLIGYQIYRNEKGKHNKDTEKPIAGKDKPLLPDNTSFFDLNVKNGKTYIYNVIGIDIEGNQGSFSMEPAEVTIEYGEPAQMPYLEHFDAVTNKFLTPISNKWGVTEDHGEWTSFSNNRHMDSNPGQDGNLSHQRDRENVRTIMQTNVHVPKHSKKPAVSFWYKSDLSGLGSDYFDDWWYWDYIDNWDFINELFSENKVIVDIISKHKVYKNVKTFKAWPPVSEYRWIDIPLKQFRGEDICIVFRQSAAAGFPGKFIMDDFRISQLPKEDTNSNGIPDPYETPINNDMLPFVKDFSVTATDIGPVAISWTAIDNQTFPLLAGYDIYRTIKDSTDEPDKINTQLIDPTETTLTDNTIENNTSYTYYMVAISSDDVQGYPTKPIFVDIAVPSPTITQQPEGIIVQERQPATFSIIAEGPGLKYQWQENDIDIPGASTDTYKIDSVTFADTGKMFKCIVTNFADSITSSVAELTVVLGPPEIVTHPKDTIAIERQPASFSVEYIGSEVNIQWQKNGVNIPGATNATYTINETPVSDNDALFKCIITNDAGEVISNEAKLTVKIAPPVITKHPENKTITERGPVSFSVEYIGSNVSFQWQKNQNDISGATNATYTKPKTVFDTDNNAKYRCIITNTTASVTSNEAVLTIVMVPPTILTQPVDLSVSVGDPANFTVSVLGSSLTYQWYKFQEPLPDSNAPNYTINKTEFSDNNAGYQCKITNPAGSVQSDQVMLLILDKNPPELTVNNPLQGTSETDMVTITGLATDKETGIKRVYIISDKFNSQEFEAITGLMGDFTSDVPLSSGENNLTIYAVDNADNATTKTISLTFALPQQPIIAILVPTNGSNSDQEYIDVSGTILSSLPSNEISLSLDNQLIFPSGSNGEYTFEFTNIQLVQGPNTIIVTATTEYGSISESIIVTYGDIEEDPDPVQPELSIYSYQPEITITDDEFTISGMAGSQSGISSVTINGEQAEITGEGAEISFEYLLEDICANAGSDGYTVEVKVTGADNTEVIRTFVIFCDSSIPAITLTDLNPAPAINSITQNPYMLKGEVADNNLASVLINDQAVGLLPIDSDRYSFEVAVHLTRDQNKTLTIEARDHAGNKISTECILKLDAALDVEIITPKDKTTITLNDQSNLIDITIRASGIADTDTIHVAFDNMSPVTIPHAGNTATASMAVSTQTVDHTLTAQAKDSSGTLLGEKTISFTTSIQGQTQTQLKVIKVEPSNMAEDIEPSAFISWYLNKEINPDLVTITIKETAHGKIYKKAESGADITDLNNTEQIEVHKDRELVAGGISWLPQKTIIAFYPDQDFAYDGTVYAELKYDGEILSKTYFNVRPLPTLVQGFVSDIFGQPLQGITISIPELDRTATTDNEGAFNYGFAEKADNMIPPGRYKLVVNPELKDLKYGTIEQWLIVEQGILNTIGIIKLPVLNSNILFTYISSGLDAIFDNNKLQIDLSSAEVIFPNGLDNGNVHVQRLSSVHIPYKTLNSAAGPWLYNIQPNGIEIDGDLHIELALPEQNKSHEYLNYLTDYMLFTGLDPESMQIIPVGVGLIDKDAKKLISARPVSMQRLDYIGYAFVPNTAVESVENYIEGKITIDELITILESI